jgi:hypothetical protein
MRDFNLQKWLMENQPEDKMLWNKSFWNEYVFWRDEVIPLFYSSRNYDYNNYDQYGIDTNKHHEVVGEHWSKSIKNPVLKLDYKGCTMVFRYNFYDYEIAIINSKDIILPMAGLFRSKEASFYYQGFSEEYQLKTRYEDNKKEFMVSIGGRYYFFTFMFLLKNELDKIM